MNELLQALSHFFSSWKFWVIVAPWEVAVRIRLGRVAASLAPGPHFRIPFLDEITIINTRLRVSTAPTVTIAGANGKVRVISATVGYRIADPRRAMLRYTHPDPAVLTLAQAEVAAGFTSDEAHQHLGEAMGENGIAVEFVRYVEDVEVKAYRLLQYGWSISHQTDGPPAPGGVQRY